MKTNDEVIAEIMKFGTPLNQVIVIHGLMYYTQQCINDGPAKFDSPMMSGAAWVDACRQINAKLAAHLNGEQAQADDGNALDRIAALMDGAEWDSDTASEIAAIVADTGRTIREPGEVE